MKRLFLIFNPKSGKTRIKQHLADIVDMFVKENYYVTVYPTQSKDDAKNQIIKYGERFNMIVCSGGDGTLSEVVDGVMTLEKKPCIGYIPAGSTNDFAVGLKLPKKILNAAKVAIGGREFAIDVGTFNGKTFVYVAAFGLFTEVSYNTSQDIKNMLGHQAYILEGLKSLTAIKTHHLTIKYDDTIIEDDFIYGMITNAVSVGGFKGLMGQKVVLDDGLFECLLIRAPKNAIELQAIVSELLGITSKKSEKIIEFKTNKLFVKTEGEVPWVLDGEYGGAPDKIVIKNHAKAVNVMSNL